MDFGGSKACGMPCGGDTGAMRERHTLIADDVDTAKIERIRGVAERDPRNVVHIARSARDAIALATAWKFDAAAIDFDFIGERETGAEIIAAVRGANRGAAIACVTARDGAAFDQAADATLAAGADAAFTSTRSFEGELRQLL